MKGVGVKGARWSDARNPHRGGAGEGSCDQAVRRRRRLCDFKPYMRPRPPCLVRFLPTIFLRHSVREIGRLKRRVR